MIGLLLVATLADPVARADAPAGSITVRPADGPVRVLPANADLPAGELLTVLPGTVARTANGAVTLACRADPTGSSPVPVLETAFALAAAPGADLVVTLDRGRIDLTNTKPAGPAAVTVKLRAVMWAVTLDTPGSRVTVELAGRRPPGTRFRPDEPPVEPVLSAVVLAAAGSATVSDGRTTVAMSAPPGPSLLNWTSTGGPPRSPLRLDRLPAWANPTEPPEVTAAVAKLRADPAAGVDRLLASKTPAEWRVGLVAAVAADDLDRLAKVLTTSADPAVWDFGVTVLRHWLGRGPGQDRRLFDFLTGPRGHDAVAAGTVIDLLAGFTPAERNRAETYDVLVEYLLHDRPAVRNLAEWHLVRMVPAGKTIPFRPNAGKDDLAAAYKQWRKLIPPGTLPAGRATEPAGKP